MKYKKHLNWIKGIVIVLWLTGWILMDLFHIPFGKWMVDSAITAVLICTGFEIYMQHKLKKQAKIKKFI